MFHPRFVRLILLLALVAMPATSLFAQQTGAIKGTVTATDGSVLPGVTVEARSAVLPSPRVTVTGGNGDYRLPALPPGVYDVKFELSGMAPVTRKVTVALALETTADARLNLAGVEESVTVTAELTLVDKDRPTIQANLSNDEISGLPVGQEYRDLQKLIPGVQYSEDLVRGPSAGGSGQDNVYQFDGVNVTMPLFGTLSAEPSSQDIAQVTVIKGGAQAVDFNRAGGFLIDSVSKTGTSEFHGELSFEMQSAGMTGDLTAASDSRYDEDRSWLAASLGGPVVKDKLYFYGSYYRPERSRENRANNYGELPKYESVRNEGFGKLTFTPNQSVLLNATYRHSKREDTSSLFGASSSATTGTGDESVQKILTLEGSWVVNSKSYFTANYTNYALETLSRPDFESSAVPTSAIGARLNINSLDTEGRLTVPSPISGATDFNNFVAPIIARYGFDRDGSKVGGGIVGYGGEFNDQDFFRDALQLGYNITVGSSLIHDLHFGFQWSEDSEELVRSSNGWGLISVPGGRLAPPVAGNPQRAYYQARYQQQGTGQAAPIISSYRTFDLEFNDTIRWKKWAFNLGVLASQDTLYGQGLREDSSTLSGYVSAPGNKYEMYKIPFSKMIQPRLGVTFTYNDSDTIYASYAKYNPAASSLPRAASWDRNLIGTFVDAFFDQNGVLFAAVPVGSSSGKLFVEDMTPRTVNEFLVGTSKQFNQNFSGRLYGRHRRGSHFWEDTNNNARVAFNPPAGIPRELYIADLDARRAQIGSGSSYVIAELDGAYTRFNEVTLEAEWRDAKTVVRGSYTWSEYYGNFDQDNSTTGNDANIFIGSSNIADAAGRQLWDFKDGTLRGDRPHLLKVFGYRTLPWNGIVGLFTVFQSGQPWETWSYEPYRALTTSTSSTNRYAEPAGSRRSDSHFQIDLKYIQNFKVGGRANLALTAELFNVFDNQTGYNIDPIFNSSQFGQPRSYYAPRRLQMTGAFTF
ncbi:MAG: carboxypeptidase regulatory-like domain-containing protein [Vicinamibacteria bacterium]|nr:carboxypeptidase regulatory-like domain-containing protein [Vicinamibacteria bacterium]